ncbi:MAG: hypothetical protein ACFB9M_15835 [Myxococcota bacterium]
MRIMGTGLGLSLSLFVMGCGPDCDSACNNLSDVFDGPAFSNPTCELQCERVETQAGAEGCEDEFDDLEDCVDDLDSQDETCVPAAEDVALCISDGTTSVPEEVFNTPIDQFVF